jgi:hypothetical protein
MATGDCQHSGLSLSALRTLAKHHQQRLRRGRKVHSKVRKNYRHPRYFFVANSTKSPYKTCPAGF